jgi:hypothetical protein
MRGSPLNGAPEHRPISTTPKARSDAAPAVSVSRSRFPAPKILMGEVAAPIPKYAASGGGGQLIAAERDAFRAFMRKHRLQPSAWARDAGVAPGEVLAFLAGKARSIPRASLEKLAAAAGAAPADLFR